MDIYIYERPSNHLESKSSFVPSRQVITAAGEANYTWITRSAKVRILQTWNNIGKFMEIHGKETWNRRKIWWWGPGGDHRSDFLFFRIFCSFISRNKKLFFGFDSKNCDFGGVNSKNGRETPRFQTFSLLLLLACWLSVAPKIAETCNVTADETCFWKEPCRSCKGSPLSLWGDLNWKKPVWRFEPKMPSFCWKNCCM